MAESFGLGPLEPLLHDPTSPTSWSTARTRSTSNGTAGCKRRTPCVRRRRAPAADHPADRRARRPPHRRALADGRRPPARRPPRERDHPAAGARRARAVDSPLRHRPARASTTCSRTARSRREMLRVPRRLPSKARINILISGGTGAGKTTLLNIAVAASFPTDERSSRSKTRPNCGCSSRTSCAWKRGRRTSKARAKSRQRDLVRNALRMRPDRIIIGEVPRRRSARHAAGHEHRPRRLADHDPRQRHARRPVPPRNHGQHGRLRAAGAGRPQATSPRPSRWSIHWPGSRAVLAA